MMQLKINNFFKGPSASTSTPTPVANDDNDDLSIWENTQQHIFITYSRTRRNPNPNPNLVESPSTVTRKLVVKNKKRSYAQLHLECGQSDFLLHACSTCGVEFSPGNEDDEKAHKEFHKCYTQGVQFRVEEVVKMIEIELGSRWIVHGHCKAYLFVSLQRIVGCVVAEPIKEAFQVESCSTADNSDSARKKEMKSSTTLQFGNIVFQREIEKRPVDVKDDGKAIICESKPVATICGIRAIWVTPSNRRKHIAGQLLDAVR